MENTPVREIRSVEVPAQFYLLGLPKSLLLLAASGFCLLFFLYARVYVIMFGIMGVGLFVGSIVWMVRSATEAFSRTTYTIYPDRIEYSEGFWNRQWRTVPFDEVVDVTLTEGVLQRGRGAGTVRLRIDPQRIQRHMHLLFRQGEVELRNVPQPREIWELIRSLVLTKGGPDNTATADRAGSTAIQEFPPRGRPGSE